MHFNNPTLELMANQVSDSEYHSPEEKKSLCESLRVLDMLNGDSEPHKRITYHAELRRIAKEIAEPLRMRTLIQDIATQAATVVMLRITEDHKISCPVMQESIINKDGKRIFPWEKEQKGKIIAKVGKIEIFDKQIAVLAFLLLSVIVVIYLKASDSMRIKQIETKIFKLVQEIKE